MKTDRRSVRWTALVRVTFALAAWLTVVALGCSNGGASSSSCAAGQTFCGTCVDTSFDPANCGACGNACAQGNVCSQGQCGLVCLGGTTQCGNVCADTKWDAANCGGCGKKCPGGQVCSQGKCSVSCTGGTKPCGTSCKDVNSDPSNCGACGTQCAQGVECVQGKCTLECGPGLTACTAPPVKSDAGSDASSGDAKSDATSDAGGQGGGSVCVDVKKDANHCGKCNFACKTGYACVGGNCTLSCQPGLVNCGGTCTNTQTDPNSCGGCGQACPGGYVCSGGQCALTCQQQLTECPNGDAGTICTDTQSDPLNCGACGQPCQQGYFCVGGACQIVCPQNYGLCGQQCFDFMNDINHCGGCYTQCWGGQVCTQGICCTPGLQNCNGACTDTSTDKNNCGSCGTTCSGNTPYCVNSQCVQCPPGATLVNGHCQIVYHVTQQSDLDGLTYTYCANSYYNYYWNSSTFGFHWTDIFPVNMTPTAIAISFTAGYTYPIWTTTRTAQLNGTAVYSYTVSYQSACVGPTYSFNVSQLSAYQSGAKNAISINLDYADGLAQSNGDYAKITVTY